MLRYMLTKSAKDILRTTEKYFLSVKATKVKIDPYKNVSIVLHKNIKMKKKTNPK